MHTAAVSTLPVYLSKRGVSMVTNRTGGVADAAVLLCDLRDEGPLSGANNSDDSSNKIGRTAI